MWPEYFFLSLFHQWFCNVYLFTKCGFKLWNWVDGVGMLRKRKEGLTIAWKIKWGHGLWEVESTTPMK